MKNPPHLLWVIRFLSRHRTRSGGEGRLYGGQERLVDDASLKPRKRTQLDVGEL